MALLCLALIVFAVFGADAGIYVAPTGNLFNGTNLLSLDIPQNIPMDQGVGTANYVMPKSVLDFIPTSCDPNNTCPGTISIITMHLEMGCIPSKTLTKFCCPANFDCASVFAKRSKTQCQYKGKLYKVGAKLTVEGLPCYTNIVCTVKNKVPGFTFTKTKCPVVKTSNTTIQLHSLTKCCSTGTRSTVLSAKEFTCNYNKISYPLGAQIPSQTTCQVCICQLGFDGTLRSPWCKVPRCGYELDAHNNILKGYAPVLGIGSCCAFSWQAPTRADVLIPNPSRPPGSKNTCKFGDKDVRYTDGLISTVASTACAMCGCLIGPMVQCGLLSDCSASMAAIMTMSMG